MKRLSLLIGGLILAAVGLAVWRTSRSAEPVYEGKPLSRWLERHVPSSAADPPYNSPGWMKAQEALEQIGTNGIPTLLQMIRAKDPPRPLLRGLEFSRDLHLIRWRYGYASQRNEEASFAFETLGPRAKDAVPALIKIYTAGVSPASRTCTAQALGHIGPAARAALPALFRDFNHTNGQVRFDAVSAVYFIGGEPEVIIPPLTRALKDPKPEIRWNASGALANLGSRARAVVPQLQDALRDPLTPTYPGLKEQFETALWRIAPEQVGRPLVVEPGTPVIAGGVTAESVDIQYKGERRTLIKLNRAVPCLTQFWDSAPRAPLLLYRHASGPPELDHFLGEFQVLGVSPPPTNANVSVLCVVADGQIVLCARDNNDHQFLEIRRIR
jgi:hypothetical protein